MGRKRNEQLQDALWLRLQYEVNQRTLTEIAALAGCSQGAVTRALQAHQIPTRTPQESRRLRGTGRRHTCPELNDTGWLHQKYTVEGLSTQQIGRLLSLTAVPVLKALRQANIPRRPPGGRTGSRGYTRISQLYDAAWLRQRYIERQQEPEAIAAELGCKENTVRSMLSRAGVSRRQPLPRTLEGIVTETRVRLKDGYRMHWRPDHPATNARGWVSEHRLMAEEALGRLLERQEVVHHVNGKRDDNRIENLLVFPTNAAHTSFHENPPAWVPRCPCCGHPCPERLTGRPSDIPLLFPL